MSKDERIKVQPQIVSFVCEKCGEGKMEKKSGGRVYVCNNPKCGIAFWISFSNDK